MKRLACSAVIALVAVGSLFAQQETRPVLRLTCTADRPSYAPHDAVALTITLENIGSSEVFLYRTLEWGWAGIGFALTDAREHLVRPKEPLTPLPPLPVHDKSELVGLAPRYFFGTRLPFELSRYHLKPGVYYIEVSYQSNYHLDDGFGLPILTFADGKFSNKVRIEIGPK
jgi:hypothetical protein